MPAEEGVTEQRAESFVPEAVAYEGERPRQPVHVPEIAREVVLERGERREALELGETRGHAARDVGERVVEADEQRVPVLVRIEELAGNDRVRRAPIAAVGLQDAEEITRRRVHLVQEGAREEQRRLRDPERDLAADPIAHAVEDPPVMFRR